jgi:RimJ/RimL family protein N-acetyltransferase
MKIKPITLEGKKVRLEPLETEHLEHLSEVAFEKSICQWSPSRITDEKDLQEYIQIALDEQKRGVSLPFVIIEKSSNIFVGSTRFGNIDVKNRRAEIGWTWINPRWHRTFVNTEAKLLMLTHAFEEWKCIRVELKTDALNEKSRNAILRLGAKEEGILRQHIITDTGRLRDTVYFSILDKEWAVVKGNLIRKLKRDE